MGTWLTFGEQCYKSYGVFLHVSEKYEILICYSQHVDLFETFYLVKNLFLFPKDLG